MKNTREKTCYARGGGGNKREENQVYNNIKKGQKILRSQQHEGKTDGREGSDPVNQRTAARVGSFTKATPVHSFFLHAGNHQQQHQQQFSTRSNPIQK